MDSPIYRPLRGYCLDPGFSTRLDTVGINEVVYRIPFEPLRPGPIGEYIEVIDFDPASNCWYEPVDLSLETIASQYGLDPSEGNPQFHQQFVYAVAMKTIGHFERALGRKIIWAPRRYDPKAKRTVRGKSASRYVQHLRIHPHALRDANAYYDPDKKALLFGYFAAADQSQGANYPGGLVFTCLSPDIVAHEMTHAILDSIHPRYIEDTNPDVPAFHEGFADIVSLLQRFTFSDLVEHQLYISGGRMDRHTVLGELATQFGEALEGNRGALRNMIGKWQTVKGKDVWVPLTPSPLDYIQNIEAHDRGAVLVATVFDAFQRIYSHRTRDLIRIATNGTGTLPEGSISRDLVRRLAQEACAVAGHLLHVCIRALDYCPPHDITFGDYLRALITADLDAAPADENGYRVALIEAFRARGIFADRVNTLSVESLRWSAPEFTRKETAALRDLAEKIKMNVRELVDLTDRRKLYDQANEVQKLLHGYFTNKAQGFTPQQWESFLNKLGLTSRPVSQLFGRASKNMRFTRTRGPDSGPPIEVHSVRPAFRMSSRGQGRHVEQILVTLSQRISVEVADDRTMVFRGGCSIIFDLDDSITASFVIQKNIKSHRRFELQRAYMLGEGDAPPASESLYADDDRPARINFNLLHQH